MSRLELTVAQKARAFLDALQAAPPPTASAREVEAWLISRVRSRRDDPDARARLRELLAALDCHDATRLPAPECETLNAPALADELAALLAARVPTSLKTKPRPTAALVAAALLLGAAAMGSGCRDEKTSCSANVSPSNFVALLQKANYFSWDEIENVKHGYMAMTPSAKCATIETLIGKTGEREIRQGLNRRKLLAELAELKMREDVSAPAGAAPQKATGADESSDKIRDQQLTKKRQLQINRFGETEGGEGPSPSPDCASDTSLEHFSQFLPGEQARIGRAARWDATKAEFAKMAPRDKKAVMADLCQMSAEEIRDCINDMFFETRDLRKTPTYDSGAGIMSAPAYKGVDF
jgi:hypothetical protein